MMSAYVRWVAFGIVLGTALSVASEAVAVRKGTRNYQPEDAGSLSPAATDREQQAAPAGTQALDACLSSWDPQTHMTKDEWRESCKRVIGERGRKPGT